MFVLLFVSNISIFDFILYLILSNFVLLIFLMTVPPIAFRSGTRILGHHKLKFDFLHSEDIRIMELSVYSLKFAESNT